MTEQQDALDDLTGSGVLDAFRWGSRTAYARVMDDFDPDTGHDQGWVGYSGYKLLVNRLDRVFSCGDFAVAPEGEGDQDHESALDLLGAGLRTGELNAMPKIKPGLVLRDDLNGSPGWVQGGWRCLLQSLEYGKSGSVDWKTKSPTKQRVAGQPAPDQIVFPGMEFLEAKDALADLSQLDVDSPLRTLVLGHAVDLDTGRLDLHLGRPLLGTQGQASWHWKVDLLTLPPSSGTWGDGDSRPPVVPNGPVVPDAPIRLRPQSERKSGPGGARP